MKSVKSIIHEYLIHKFFISFHNGVDYSVADAGFIRDQMITVSIMIAAIIICTEKHNELSKE